ncbi:EutN/CcmL family microcompartment protein [candidate division KSB1 bacterium]|nr:EutN/CcmL family microcompartment protein [candidate division KSB1 bacterium]
MKLGRIEGKVWATIKDEKLKGVKLYIMQPIDEYEQPLGAPVIAADTIGTREGDIVYWVSGAEGTFVLDAHQIPSEASIVGLVDRLDVADSQ